MEIKSVRYTIWAKDLERALRFYEALGGVRGTVNPAGCVVTLAGATLFIHSGGSGEETWTGMTFAVDDVVAGADGVMAAGGTLRRKIEDTEEEPAHLAFCQDTEGNQFMLSRPRG